MPTLRLTSLAVFFLAAAFPLPARASVDADAAGQKAGAIAQSLDLPWGEPVEVVRESAAGRYGDREHWVVKYFDFAEVAIDAGDGSVVRASNRSAIAEFMAQPTAVKTSEDEARQRAVQVATAMGVFSQPVSLYDVQLNEFTEGELYQWHVRWVRTAEGIPYRSDMAIVMLDPTTGKLLGAGRAFWSRPPDASTSSGPVPRELRRPAT